MTSEESATYRQIRADAETAAGPLVSLRTRARGYLELYHVSDGVCIFALVAAQGALWASWYLVCAKLAAMFFACSDPTCRLSPRARYRQFSAYVLVLKDINKSVMVETYVLIHTIKTLGADVAIAAGFPEGIVRDYDQTMRTKGNDPAFLRDLYHRHFLWEQDRVVSDKLDQGFEAFKWPFMRGLCQKPWVWFSYFRPGKSMNFKCFTDREERVEKGLVAYDRAVAMGLDRLAHVSAARLKIYPGRTQLIARYRRSIP